MNDRFARAAFAGLALLIVVAALQPAPLGAQSAPAIQRVVSRGVTHVFYGRIDAARGSALYVRVRSGRLMRVDASEAIRADAFSAPLFPGKIVVIEGYLDAVRTVHATSVMRMGSLDAATPLDR